MQAPLRKAVVISPIFATIFSALAVSAILGGISYAVETNKDMNGLKIELSTTQVNIKNLNEAINRIEIRQEKMYDKLDKVLEKRQ